jgi:hypothetical protein
MMSLRSPIPEKANEIYHIVVMDWWVRWKKYTNYDKIIIESDETTLGETESATTLDTMVDNFDNLHLHKESEEKKVYPGEINDEEEINKLLIDEPFLKHPNDEVTNRHLKTSVKEDEDFVILPDDAWKYLLEIYDGFDMPRYSIKIEADDGNSEKDEFMIEIYLKKLFIYILPKVRHHLCLKKPSAVYISRKKTVLDFRRKIGEILHDNKKEVSVIELMNYARIWRLETGENAFEIEKFFDHETNNQRDLDSLPM